MKRSALTSLLCLIVWVGGLSASISTAQQAQQSKPLQFEVAAIKPSDPGLGVYSSSTVGAPGGQFRMVNVPLKQWLEMGLSVRDYALKAPSWLDTSRFDLDARLPHEPADQKATAEMVKLLLIERFGLKWHEEYQNLSGYQLVADKKVLIQAAGLLERLEGHQGSSSGPTMIGGTNLSMSEFATLLEQVLGKPVVDETHLSGGFDFKVMWRPSDDAELASQQRYGKQDGFDVDNLPSSVSVALREQLGLGLQSAKISSKVMVVDSINREPTKN